MRSFYILASILVLAACSSDEPGTSSSSSSASASGGSGGAGGDSTSASGGAGGATSSTGSGGAGGAIGTGGSGGDGGTGGTPIACAFGSDVCGSDMYCAAPGCQKGVCKPKPTTESPAKSVVCGCDGANYWNESVAGSRGMAVRTDGPCAGEDAVYCGGHSREPAMCPGETACVHVESDVSACSLVDGAGTCWAMPADCTGSTAKAKTCDAGGCVSECQLIADQERVLVDGSCP